jgi:6,7-dimethyl-8-ribityllumazine synthase
MSTSEMKTSIRMVEGKLDATAKHFVIIVSRFNAFISEQLLSGAMDCLLRHGAASSDIDVYRVPGSFEIPFMANEIAKRKKHAAIICLGVLVRGQTPHFDYLAAEAAKGIGQVGMNSGIPTIFGVVTADTLEQAIERAGTKAGNKGWDAALAAIEMASLMEQL